MPRLTRTDRLLLATLLPLVALVLGLHLREAFGAGIPEPPIFASPSPDGSAYPIVGGLRLERGADWGGLEPGDRLIAVGDRDLAGVGYFGFDVIAVEQAGPGLRTTLVYEHDGERRSAPFETRIHALPWYRVPGVIAFMIAGVWVVLRSPGSRDAQLFFAAFSLFSIFMLPLQSPTPWLMRLHLIVFNVGGSLAFTAILLWSLSFPPGIPPEKRLSPWWASLGLLHGLVRTGYWVPGPIPRAAVPNLALSVDLLFIVVSIGFIARNYRYADPTAKRRVRWVVFATGGWTLLMGAAAFVGVVATDAAGFDFPALVVISGLFAALVPVAVVVSVVRYNLFDINRLLSATAAYSLALIVAAAVAIGATTLVGAPLAGGLGVSPVVTQSSLLVLLAAIAIPAAARMRPQLDRLFFPDRALAQSEAAQLLRDLPQCERPDDVMALLARRVHAIFRVRDAGTFRRRGDGFAADGFDVRFGRTGAFAQLLERNTVPLHVDGGRARAVREVGGDELRALGAAGIEICVPLRVGPDLMGFVALGPKLTGDVFTTAELSSLGAIGSAASAELLRMRDAGLIESAQQHASEMTRLREQAEKANRAKSNLLAAVSHDLRQPLHAIGLLSETLEGQIAGAKAQATLSKIQGATTALADMIASLLDLSRLEAGTLQPEVGDVVLDALLLGVVDEFEEVARRKHLQLRYDASGVIARTDALMLGRIVRNLLSNAVRYTDKGGVSIAVVESGGEVELRVSDTGPGIPLERQSAIFDEFVRLETGGEGLGLGLAIVKGLTDLLGHRVSLESELGRGTTFSVFLPAAREAGDAAKSASSLAAGEPEASLADRVGRPFAGRLFVVVDDDLRVLDAMRSMLETWGAEVIVAANVDDVVSSLERTRPRPDLVIADYHLDPHTTGLDAIEVIRRTLGRDVPALAITAETSADAVGAIRAAGLPVLTKPVKPARLRAMIAELVG